MVQSPSWEANWFVASQETPRISRNPKVHYRTHKRPPPVPILGQPNPVHIHTSHFLEIRQVNVVGKQIRRLANIPSGQKSGTSWVQNSQRHRYTDLLDAAIKLLLLLSRAGSSRDPF